MTWAQQVIHVIRKDANFTRWIMLAMATITAAMTWHATANRATDLQTWFLFVGLTAMIGVCLVVQADPPCQSVAFWATKPLDPTAIAVAKLLDVLFILALLRATTSVIVAITSPMAIGAPDTLAKLYDMLTPLLAGAAIVAALTPDLRIFLVTMIFSIIGASFLLIWPGTYLSTGGAIKSPADVLDLVVAGSAPLLLYAYRTRSFTRTTIATLVLVLTVQVIAIALVITG